MLNVILDTLALRGTLAPYFVLQSMDGLEAPAFRVSQYDNPGESGVTVGSEFYSGRSITLIGEIAAPDVTTYASLRAALATACRIRKDSNSFPQAVTLQFTTMDGVSYYVNGYVTSFKNPFGLPTYSAFMIVFLVTDPMIYLAASSTSGLVSRPVGGGVIFPVTFPAIFSGGTGGTTSLSNAGNADTYPIIYLRGPLTNPSISNLTSGVVFQLNYTTTNVTDVITIDMKKKTVMLNGTTSLLAYKASGSDWFSLASGNNNIAFSTGASGDTGTMEVTFNSAYLGV